MVYLSIFVIISIVVKRNCKFAGDHFGFWMHITLTVVM